MQSTIRTILVLAMIFMVAAVPTLAQIDGHDLPGQPSVVAPVATYQTDACYLVGDEGVTLYRERYHFSVEGTIQYVDVPAGETLVRVSNVPTGNTWAKAGWLNLDGYVREDTFPNVSRVTCPQPRTAAWISREIQHSD